MYLGATVFDLRGNGFNKARVNVCYLNALLCPLRVISGHGQ